MNYNAKATKWHTKPLTKTVRLVLEEGSFPVENTDRWEAFLEDTKDSGRTLATLEYPALDIELEMWRADGEEYSSVDKDETGITLSYFVCIKYGEDESDWESHGFVDADNIFPTVNFLSPTWEQDLRADMEKNIREYAEKHGLSLTDTAVNAKAA